MKYSKSEVGAGLLYCIMCTILGQLLMFYHLSPLKVKTTTQILQINISDTLIKICDPYSLPYLH